MTFNPTPEEMEARREILTWMHAMGWEQTVIDSIMYDDTPTPDQVREWVYRYGPEATLNRIRVLIYD